MQAWEGYAGSNGALELPVLHVCSAPGSCVEHDWRVFGFEVSGGCCASTPRCAGPVFTGAAAPARTS